MSIFKSIKLDTNNASGDPFGRQRVSNPETLFDSKQIFDNQPLFWDDQETSGSGTTSTHSTDLAASTIGVGATTAGTRVRQTFQRFNYQPGKGQLIFLTGVIDKSGGGTDIIRRVGIFDDNNGLYFEDNAGALNVVRRTYTSGSAVNNSVAQASWNIDPLDGSGPSGITLDISKANIFVIDFEWLGIGRVRMGVNIDGITYLCHEFLNANNLTTVYMSTPNLPLRYEISNGGTGAASTMDHVCASVISEGGVQDNGIVRYASTEGTHVSTNAENSLFAIVGIRLKSGYLGAAVKVIGQAVLLASSTETIEWNLVWNPTSVAGTFTYADETNSAVQIARGGGNNTITGGILLAGGYVSTGNTNNGGGDAFNRVETALSLGSAIDGSIDELILAVRPVDGSSSVDIEGSLTWRELS